MAISRRAVTEFLERDFDSFTWMKGLRREQIERELAQFRVPPVFKTRPWLHQLVCFYVAMCQPRFLFLLDMGLGKTKLVSDVVTQLLRERRLTRALVGVPRLINVESWKDDLERHSDLGYQLVNCEDTAEKRDRLLYPPKDADVTLVDFQGLHLAMCDKVPGRKGRPGKLVPNEAAVRRLRSIYNFVDIDESHKLSNTESLWFHLLRQVCESADFVYATTGTLFGKEVLDLWPQFYLVDGGETFGANSGIFEAAFFETKAGPWKVEQKFIRRMDRTLHRMLQHRSLRYSDEEVPELELPRLQVIPLRLDMTEEQRGHYTNALEGLINAGGQLSQLDGQWTRMRQICSGYLTWNDENGTHLVPFKRNPKLERLESLLDEMLPRSKVVVAYSYTESGRLVSQRLSELGIGHEWFWGGSKDHGAQRRRFMEDAQCKVFVMQVQAGGEGTDGLQKVARFGVMYETPSSPTLRKQTIKRVHRSGSAAARGERVHWYDLAMRRSLEPGILADIAEGTDLYERVVNGRGSVRNLLLCD